jgi:signal peptide peptidase SppA
MPKKCCWSKCMNLFKAKSLVNVINLNGVIGSVGFKQGLTLSHLNIAIEKAFTGKNIKAVALNINSPGGSPVQSELIAKRISQLSKEKEIPVIAFIEDMAASGGYWIACSASEVIAAENSILGSLGVIFSGFGFNKAIDRLGVERRVHTQGGSKSLLDPFTPEKEEDVGIIKKVQADIYQNFKNQVHNGRQDKLKIADEELFSGAVWSGARSVEIGLADKIGDFYSEMNERFGDDVVIKIVNQEKSWFKRKLGIALDSIAESVGQFILSDKKFELR